MDRNPFKLNRFNNMYRKVTKVVPEADHTLLLTFDNGEQRRFDVKPYLDKGIFQELKEPSVFYSAHVSFDTVEWDNEADLDPEVLYSASVPA